MIQATYNGLTRCQYKSWEECKLQHPNCDVKKASKKNRCMWLDEEIENHCTNAAIQKIALEEYRKEKIS